MEERILCDGDREKKAAQEMKAADWSLALQEQGGQASFKKSVQGEIK